MASAAQHGGRPARIAKLHELRIGQDRRTSPELGVEEDEKEETRRFVPPDPVPEHPLRAHQRRGGERASVAKKVAAIEVPANHHGSERPATKYSSMFCPARRVNQKPRTSVTAP
jgi:hypothetical protein